MGLDDLSALELMAPMLALLVAVVVSGPASIASHLAWRWSLARIADRQTVRPAQAAGVLALVATGAPAAYCVLLATALTGLTALLGLAIVAAVAALALVHAAYRVECIRVVAGDRVLADALSSVPHAGDRRAQVHETARSSSLPSFAGATRRRSLMLAAIVLLAWGVVAMLLAANPQAP